MLEEPVEIWSVDPPKRLTTSKLVVGEHGLPVLFNNFPPTPVWLFPAAWKLVPVQSPLGPLFHAWRDIEDVREEIRQAQREAEQEAPREPDALDCGKAYLEREGLR